jgi:hypothetical protein
VKVQAVAVDTLTPLPGNPRRGDLESVKRSLTAFGQQKPIVVSRASNEVIAGNHTLLAARALGWESIDVAWSDLTPAQAKAYAAADNRTHDLGTYDDELLAALLNQIDDDLLPATGYDDFELVRLLGTEETPDFEPVNELMELPLNPVKDCPHCGGHFRMNSLGVAEPA